MDARTPPQPPARAPKVSFVSLGCPKALVDSERIITRLRAEGYELTRAHAGADLVVVNTCSFCIIPKLRGDLVSRPAADVLREAERLVAAGVKELLVISQDTSAYGVDLKYAASEWKGRELRAKFLDLARALGELGVWVRLHYVYPYPHVDA